jgi:hypothetical protein
MSVNPNHTSRSRDAALRRLHRANRWLIAGSATLTGVLTAVAASAFPGKTLKETRARSAGKAHRSTGATGTRTGSGTSTGTSTLKAAKQAPQTSTTEGSSSAAEGSSPESSSSGSEGSSATQSETTETPVTSGGS